MSARRKRLLFARRRGWLSIGAPGLGAEAVGAVVAGSALAASPSGTVTETINVGVRSLTVSPSSVRVDLTS